MNFSKLKQEQARKVNCHYSYGIPLRDFRDFRELLFHLRHMLRHYMKREVEAVVCSDQASLKTHCNQKEEWMKGMANLGWVHV